MKLIAAINAVKNNHLTALYNKTVSVSLQTLNCIMKQTLKTVSLCMRSCHSIKAMNCDVSPSFSLQQRTWIVTKFPLFSSGLPSSKQSCFTILQQWTSDIIRQYEISRPSRNHWVTQQNAMQQKWGWQVSVISSSIIRVSAKAFTKT